MLHRPHSSVLVGCLAGTRPIKIWWRIQECRVGAATLFIQIFNGMCNMLTCVWSGILIKEFWNFSCGMYSMTIKFQTSSSLNLAVRIHNSSLGTKFRETPPILSKMNLSHVTSCLWPTFTFNLPWRYCVVSFLRLWLGFGFILLQKGFIHHGSLWQENNHWQMLPWSWCTLLSIYGTLWAQDLECQCSLIISITLPSPVNRVDHTTFLL